MGGLSLWHWVIVVLVVVLLFGRGRISDMMGDLAKGIKSFKKGLADDDPVADKAAAQLAQASAQPGPAATPVRDEAPRA